METDDTADRDPVVAYIHGACLVFLDSLGTGKETLSSRHWVKILHVASFGWFSRLFHCILPLCFSSVMAPTFVLQYFYGFLAYAEM